jgi:hypothetical protein
VAAVKSLPVHLINDVIFSILEDRSARHYCCACSIFSFNFSAFSKPVLGGVDGNLHFPVPSMNRLNQTEPATFSILPCWAFFRGSIFIYFVINASDGFSHILLLYCIDISSSSNYLNCSLRWEPQKSNFGFL